MIWCDASTFTGTWSRARGNKVGLLRSNRGGVAQVGSDKRSWTLHLPECGAGIAGPSEQMIMHEPVKRSRLLATAAVNLVVVTQADHVEVCVRLD
jgi:hypothetical protein